MSETYDTIMKIGDSFEDAYSYDLVKQKDYMPDFVSVMGDVVSEHWKRAAAKVNKALGAEIRKQGKEQEKLALAAVKGLGLDFAGVDILFGKDNEPILCEVNSNAQFRALLGATGIDITDALFEHIRLCVSE